jgi:hypothetical protein
VVDAALPNMENDVEHFGEQFVVDATGEFVRREPRLLLTSAQLSLTEAIEGVARLGGLAIPAHVDRVAFGLMANLGFVPTDVPIPALEISRHLKPAEAVVRFPQLDGFPLVRGGDAHRLEELLGANLFRMEAPTVAELKWALQGQAGRRLRVV